MKNYPQLLKNELSTIINEMAKSFVRFVKEPNKDFTRNRKLPFELMMHLILSMGGNSIYNELLEYNQYDVNTVTTSAFVQQRDKILPFAFKFLFHKFTNAHKDIKTYQGYRLLAVDGSCVNIAHNSKDKASHFGSKCGRKGFNQLHLNVIYDLCNKLYIDACIQGGRKEDEFRALCDMVDQSSISRKTIILADRGYESYNVFAHMEQKGWSYVIRVKDIKSNGVLSSFHLPDAEFDVDIKRILTRKQTNEIKKHPEMYKILPMTSPFDFFDEYKSYPISWRVVRFKLSENSYETIITNLGRLTFSTEDIKSLYNRRWGIETSFRELKYALGLVNFHAKKAEYINQEIYAKLIMYNFSHMIITRVVIKQKASKHSYQANITVAIHICRYFFRSKGSAPPLDVEALIEKNILPIRYDRHYTRRVKTKSAISFTYRIV